MPEPNPEQTCSLISLVLYSFLDPVIIQGYKVSHLTPDQLPPLSDSNRAAYLTGKAFPVRIPFAVVRQQLLILFRSTWMFIEEQRGDTYFLD